MLGLLLSAAVAAAPAQPTPARPAVALVCHTEPIEGSRITRKVCMTAAEAAQRRLDARQMLSQAQGSSGGQATPMMGPMH